VEKPKTLKFYFTLTKVFVINNKEYFKHFKNMFWVLMVAFVVLIEQDASCG
jgi:hypothetical protein